MVEKEQLVPPCQVALLCQPLCILQCIRGLNALHMFLHKHNAIAEVLSSKAANFVAGSYSRCVVSICSVI